MIFCGNIKEYCIESTIYANWICLTMGYPHGPTPWHDHFLGFWGTYGMKIDG